MYFRARSNYLSSRRGTCNCTSPVIIERLIEERNNRYLSYSDTKNCLQGLVELLVTLEHCAPTLFFLSYSPSPPFFLSSIDFPAINRWNRELRLPRQELVRYCKKKSARIKNETSIIEHPILKNRSFFRAFFVLPS